MNTRQISLPELVTEKRRNTTLSLSEGFAGANHNGALAATGVTWAPKPFTGSENSGSALGQVLPLYYRTRQVVLTTEKGGNRVPASLQSEMKHLEQAVAKEMRKVHPLLFQRFDDLQLDRLLRAMAFLRLSSGRWIFGSEQLGAAWPASKEARSFILLSGKVSLFPDNLGGGERMEIRQGTVFGENRFKLGDETIQDVLAASAHCDEPCIVGMLSSAAIEAAYADRAFGNRRIAQMVKHVPAFARVVNTGVAMTGNEDSTVAAAKAATEAEASNAVLRALQDLSKVATAVHILPNQSILSDDPLDESVLILSKGALEIRADVTLMERLDALPPKKVRLRVYVDKAEKLGGGASGRSLFEKLDPYCIVKMGDYKRFQTPVVFNGGPNAKFDYSGVLTYGREQEVEITVMDHDKFAADELCGSVTIPLSELYDGWSGCVQLLRPKGGLSSAAEGAEEPAGKLYFSVRWDYEKVSALTRTPKERKWTDQVLLNLKENDVWGHEQLILGALFKRTLEQATSQMPYTMFLDNFRIVGAVKKGDSAGQVITCWKANKKRFMDFVKHCGREKQFQQACRNSSLDKQSVIRDYVKRLIAKWEEEEQAGLMRQGVFGKEEVEEVLDPARFRVVYRGTKVHITVRNGLNLTSGGWFEKMDPYVIVRFRGQKAEIRTSVLQDSGGDPVWDCEGTLTYNGETSLELAVWDYDKYSADELVATGILQVEQFSNGFEGMIPLTLPGGKKKKSMKQSMLVIGVQWDPPKDPTGTLTATSLNALTNTYGS